MNKNTNYLPESSTAYLLDDAARRGGRIVGDEPFGVPIGYVFTALGVPQAADIRDFMVNDFKPISFDSTQPPPVIPITDDGNYYICCTVGTELELTSATGQLYGLNVDTDVNGDTCTVVATDVILHVNIVTGGADVLLKNGTVLYYTRVGNVAVVPHSIREVTCGTYLDKNNIGTTGNPLRTWTKSWRVVYKELPPDENGVVQPNIIEIDNDEDGVTTLELVGSGEKNIAACRVTKVTTDLSDRYGIPAAKSSDTNSALPGNYFNGDRTRGERRTRFSISNGVATYLATGNYDSGIYTTGAEITTHRKSVVVGTVLDTYITTIPTYSEEQVLRNLLLDIDVSVYNGAVIAVRSVGDLYVEPDPNKSIYTRSVFETSYDVRYGFGTYLFFDVRTDRTWWSNGIVCLDNSFGDSDIAYLVRGVVPSPIEPINFSDISATLVKKGMQVSPVLGASSFVTPYDIGVTGVPYGYASLPDGSVHTLWPTYSAGNRAMPTVPPEDVVAALPSAVLCVSAGAQVYAVTYANIHPNPPPDSVLQSIIDSGLLTWDGTTYSAGASIMSSIPELQGAVFGIPPSVEQKQGITLPSRSDNEPVSLSGNNSFLSVERLGYSSITCYIDSGSLTEYWVYGAVVNSRRTVAVHTFRAATVEETIAKNTIRAKTPGVTIYPHELYDTVVEQDPDLSGANDTPHPDFTLATPAPPQPPQTTDVSPDEL